MIRTLFVGAARVLFNAAVLALALAGVLGYASYRLLRAGVARDDNREVRVAGFALMAAAVTLAKALGADRLPVAVSRDKETGNAEQDEAERGGVS